MPPLADPEMAEAEEQLIERELDFEQHAAHVAGVGRNAVWGIAALLLVSAGVIAMALQRPPASLTKPSSAIGLAEQAVAADDDEAVVDTAVDTADETDAEALLKKNKAPVPLDIVLSTMKKFEDNYNADETAKSAASYADTCDVTVNNGTIFAGQTPDAVAGFLGQLRNKLGGTNMKFAITRVDGPIHEDVWVADNGAGTCYAVWEKVDDKWLITSDIIKFTPKASGKNDGGVPVETVMSAMQAFEDHFNANDTAKSAEAYAKDCDVTVNGGSIFAGKTSAEVAGFLATLRNTVGAKNIKFAVTRVDGFVHEDVWVSDAGAGTCKATWAEVDGKWKIVKDEIGFEPKAQ